jgi:hypothetical protein
MITNCEYGVITVNDDTKGLVSYKDCKLCYNNNKTESKKWDWSVTNTHHNPGIQINDLYDIEQNIQGAIVLLSSGYDDCLKVTPELISHFKSNNMEYKVAKTEEIVKWYNELIKLNKKVVALIHTTC